MRKQSELPQGHEETGFPGKGFYSEVSGKEVSLGEVPCHTCIFSRLVHTYVKKLGLKLNKFIQYDGNTWYLINGKRHRSREVQDNPGVLGYSMSPTEKAKSPSNLFDQSIAKVPPASPLPGSGKKKFWPKVTWQVSG